MTAWRIKLKGCNVIEFPDVEPNSWCIVFDTGMYHHMLLFKPKAGCSISAIGFMPNGQSMTWAGGTEPRFAVTPADVTLTGEEINHEVIT